MTRSRTTSYRIGNEDIKVMDSFSLLRSAINCKGTISQEICHRKAFNRAAIKKNLVKDIQML